MLDCIVKFAMYMIIHEDILFERNYFATYTAKFYDPCN